MTSNLLELDVNMWTKFMWSLWKLVKMPECGQDQ